MTRFLLLAFVLTLTACGAEELPSEDAGAELDVTADAGALCGDGVIDEGEECDDGPSWNPGCLACRVSGGWSCEGEPSVCVEVDGGIPDVTVDVPIVDDAGGTDVPETARARCGDGVIEADEECDDGNWDRDDGCAGCQVTSGWRCVDEPSVCDKPCGNGEFEDGEECDDGNEWDRDGCSAICELEPGWLCDDQWPTTCETLCGNGVIDDGEECDSAGAVGGCARCRVVPTWTCEGEPSVCTRTCGDGVVDPDEECDDGAGASLGCIACYVTRGWTCEGEPSVCSSRCGNGVLDSWEECDDGGNAPDDGCTDRCRVELGWNCSSGVCVRTCGDGTVDEDEACDDGNTADGDGCSSRCSLETCGDGRVGVGEECEPGDVSHGDRCTNRCLWEDDYVEERPVVCGDARLGGVRIDHSGGWSSGDFPEMCDDGNAVAGDGCASCRLEAGWTCVGEPSVCFPSCGEESDEVECMYAASTDGGCYDVPKPVGTPCTDGGYCDGRGGCVNRPFCQELPDGTPCDDGTGALDLRCASGECVPNPALPCDDGWEVDGRCWPLARMWYFYGNTGGSAVQHRSVDAGVSAPNPVGVGPRAPAAYLSGSAYASVGGNGCWLPHWANAGNCVRVCGSASASASGVVVSDIVDGLSRRRRYEIRGPVMGEVVSVYGGASISRSFGIQEGAVGASFNVSLSRVGECPPASGPHVLISGECVPTRDNVEYCGDDGWTDVQSSELHCGGCGNACGPSFRCWDGTCSCVYDTESDPMNCGACDNVCGEGADCVDGACVCPFDTLTDPDNCGSCGNACPERHSCVEGACECDADVLAENPDACDGCPFGFAGRYCQFECPRNERSGLHCNGPEYGSCVERDGAGGCDCYDASDPTCSRSPMCTLERSTPL